MKKKIIHWWGKVQWRKFFVIFANIANLILLSPYLFMLGMSIYVAIAHKPAYVNLGFIKMNHCYGDSCKEECHAKAP